MKPKISILVWLLMPAAAPVVRAQAPSAPAGVRVLIVLRQPAGPIGNRLAAVPAKTPVPEEVRAAAEGEQALLVKAQQEAFGKRLASIGATAVIPYPGLNMFRAEIPAGAMSSLESDPVVLSLTALSGDSSRVMAPPRSALAAANPRAAVQPPPVQSNAAVAGMPAAMPPGFNSIAGLTPAPAGTTPGMIAPALTGALTPTAGLMPAPPPNIPGMNVPALPGALNSTAGLMPGMPFLPQPAGLPGSGGTFQALMGVTGQMGAQMGMAMPKAAGILALAAGGAQVAQIIVSRRKPPCKMTLDATTARVPATGGKGTFVVRASPSCVWLAQSTVEWLQVENESVMTGPGVVLYRVAGPVEGSRTGVITVAEIAKTQVTGKTSVTVRQGE